MNLNKLLTSKYGLSQISEPDLTKLNPSSERFTAIKWREDFLSQSIPVTDTLGKVIVRQAKTNRATVHMIMRQNTTILATVSVLFILQSLSQTQL